MGISAEKHLCFCGMWDSSQIAIYSWTLNVRSLDIKSLKYIFGGGQASLNNYNYIASLLIYQLLGSVWL